MSKIKTIKCDYCGKEFERYPSAINKFNNFCSKECNSFYLIKYNKIEIIDNIGNIIINSKKYGKKISIIDVDDIKKVKGYTWYLRYNKSNNSFYITNGKNRIDLHRLITNCPKGLEVDHINHNTLDNRKCNLRITNRFGNMQNRNDNKSGCVGVFWYAKKNKWIAYIAKNNKRKYLGYFIDKDKAIEARKEAELKYA